MATPRRAREAIWTAQDAANVCARYFVDCPQGRLVVLHLDHERRLIHLGLEEPPTAAQLPVRTILTDAIRYGAAGFVVAYCRGSGALEPAEAELAAVSGLAEAAAGLGLTLHDHLICAAGEWRSLRGLGLL
jgi:DNA repair protein RadC